MTLKGAGVAHALLPPHIYTPFTCAPFQPWLPLGWDISLGGDAPRARGVPFSGTTHHPVFTLSRPVRSWCKQRGTPGSTHPLERSRHLRCRRLASSSIYTCGPADCSTAGSFLSITHSLRPIYSSFFIKVLTRSACQICPCSRADECWMVTVGGDGGPKGGRRGTNMVLHAMHRFETFLVRLPSEMASE